jgi:hypothetical protein
MRMTPRRSRLQARARYQAGVIGANAGEALL